MSTPAEMIAEEEDFDAAFEKFAAARQSTRRPHSALSQFPTAAVAWLALTPAIPLRFARLGFPCSNSGLATGDEVAGLLQRMAEARLCAASRSGELLTYSMDDGQRTAAAQYLIEQHEAGWLREECHRAANALLRAQEQRRAEAQQGSDIAAFLATLPPELEAWCTLAAAPAFARAQILRNSVRLEIDRARENKLNSAPEAVRWVELAKLLARFLPADFELPIAVARTRIEIYHRERTDERWLANYFPRRVAEDALRRFITTEGDPWALHFLGRGGMGKTMLLRNLTAHLAREHQLATVRVDFDHVHPDFPTRQPGLLLRTFAEHLRAYGPTERVFEKFDDYDFRLTELAQSGRAADVESDAFGEMLSFFCDGLHSLASTGLRPVLILDTCEELAKLRPDGRLPENVIATFKILKKIHDRVPAVRVIFAGRRPLLRDDSLIGPTEMHVIELTGFDDAEAAEFLAAYHISENDNTLTVPQTLRPAILAQRTKGETAHNPYELDLLAKWACTDASLSPEKLAAGGHAYIRERILGRLTTLRPYVPVVTLMGRFDTSLLAGILPQDVAEEFTRLEWVDRASDLPGHTVWQLDDGIRAKLLAYYRAEEASQLNAAASILIGKLTPLTLETPFADLAPSLAAALLDTFAEARDWAGAAAWWEKLEARIAAEARWEWAAELTALALANDGTSYPGVAAAIFATHAAVLRRAPDASAERLYGAWGNVIHHLLEMPAGPWTEVLRWRASFGEIAARAALEDTPKLVLAEAKSPRSAQVAVSALAAAEAILESVELTDHTGQERRRDLSQLAIHCLAHAATANGDPVLAVWHTALVARAHSLVGGEFTTHLTAFGKTVESFDTPSTRIRDCWHDWTAPANFKTRLALEYTRLVLNHDVTAALPAAIQLRPDKPTVDHDRLLSASFLIAQARRSADDSHYATWLRELGELNEQATALLAAYQPTTLAAPTCAAHRLVPPFQVAAFEALAMEGFVETGVGGLGSLVALAISDSSNTRVLLDLQNAAERALTRVCIAYRLPEDRRMRPLESIVRDRELFALRALLRLTLTGEDSTSPEANTTSEHTLQAALRAEESTSPSLDALAKKTGHRRAARAAEREAAAAAARLDDEKAAKLHLLARAWFEAEGDLVGDLRVQTALALAGLHSVGPEAARKLRAQNPSLPALPFEDDGKGDEIPEIEGGWSPLIFRAWLAAQMAAIPGEKERRERLINIGAEAFPNTTVPADILLAARPFPLPLEGESEQPPPVGILGWLRRFFPRKQPSLQRRKERKFDDAITPVAVPWIAAIGLTLIYHFASGLAHLLAQLPDLADGYRFPGTILLLGAVTHGVQVIRGHARRDNPSPSWLLTIGIPLAIAVAWPLANLLRLGVTAAGEYAGLSAEKSVLYSLAGLPVLIGIVDSIRHRARAGILVGLLCVLLTGVIAGISALVGWAGQFAMSLQDTPVSIWQGSQIAAPFVAALLAVLYWFSAINRALIRMVLGAIQTGYRIEPAVVTRAESVKPSTAIHFTVSFAFRVVARSFIMRLWGTVAALPLNLRKAQAAFEQSGPYSSRGLWPRAFRSDEVALRKITEDPIETRLVLGRGSELHSAPWEALIRAQFGIASPGESLRMFRRVAGKPVKTPQAVEASVFILAEDPAAQNPFADRKITLPFKMSGDFSLCDASVLMLHGDPVPTNLGVELRLHRRAGRDQRAGRTLSTGDILAQTAGKLRVCILNGLPREDDEFKVRTTASREDAGMLRVFASELAASGTAVIVLPPLPVALSRSVWKKLTTFLVAPAMSTRGWLLLLRELQNDVFNHRTYSENEDNAELASDLVAYIPDDFLPPENKPTNTPRT